MNIQSTVLLVIIIIALAAAVYFAVKNAAGGTCGGRCTDCREGCPYKDRSFKKNVKR